VLFVVLSEGSQLDDALRSRLDAALRTSLSPRHVPDAVYALASVPRTLSGKKLEVPAKRILAGTPAEEAASRGALANPEALDALVALAAEPSFRARFP
jgi:acetoacetyl-CoA synthetase